MSLIDNGMKKENVLFNPNPASINQAEDDNVTHFLDFSVLFHVIAEVAVSGKHLLTYEALKVPFACMGDLVRYQMDLLPERLVAGLAGELFHS